MRIETRITDREMGERAMRLPPRPRIVLGNTVVVPQVDVDWQPITDMWMLPGRGQPMTTAEVRDLAHARGLAFELIN